MTSPKPPLPRTALSAGGLPPDHPDALTPRKRTVKRKGVWLDLPNQVQPWIAEGRANIEDLEPNMFSRFIRRQTPENYDDISGTAAALFRAPQDETIRFGLKRTFDAVDQGLDPSHILSDPRRKKSLSDAEAELIKWQAGARKARESSGVYAGAPTHDRMTFRYANGQDAFEVPPETGRIAISDPSYSASFSLIGAALGHGDQDAFAEMATVAIRATAKEATTFDELAIDPVETRIAIAAKTAEQLRSGTLSQSEKKAKLQLLTTTLFAEAMPQTRAVRFILDAIPGPGNVREAERSYESSIAAKKALAEGDATAALGHAFTAIFTVSAPPLGSKALARSLGKPYQKRREQRSSRHHTRSHRRKSWRTKRFHREACKMSLVPKTLTPCLRLSRNTPPPSSISLKVLSSKSF